MFTRKISLVFILLFSGLVLFGLFFYVFRPTKNLKRAHSDYTLSANQLFKQFYEDEGIANNKFLGKVIDVHGKVKNVDAGNKHITIILETVDPISGINCSLSQKYNYIKDSLFVGKEILVRGECSGKLIDVNLNNCILIEIVN
jgi:hypothetical protein